MSTNIRNKDQLLPRFASVYVTALIHHHLAGLLSFIIWTESLNSFGLKRGVRSSVCLDVMSSPQKFGVKTMTSMGVGVWCCGGVHWKEIGSENAQLSSLFVSSRFEQWKWSTRGLRHKKLFLLKNFRTKREIVQFKSCVIYYFHLIT